MTKPIITDLQVVSSKAPSLKDGHDESTAKELIKRFKDAQNAGRRIMSFGLFAWEIKTMRLKHGQWGPWLAANASEVCRPHSKTGILQPSASLSSYMQMTKDVLEDFGFTIEKYFKHIEHSKELGVCHGGKFLLLPDKKLNEPALKLKKEFCDRVDGKTAKQIRLSFNQVEESDDGEVKPKRGRLKGEGGVSKEQRAAAKAAEAQAEITAMELEAEDFCRWIDHVADTAHLPKISDKVWNKLFERMNLLGDFMAQVNESRKGGSR